MDASVYAKLSKEELIALILSLAAERDRLKAEKDKPEEDWRREDREWEQNRAYEIAQLHAEFCFSRGWHQLGVCALVGPGDAMLWKHKDGRVWMRSDVIRHELQSSARGISTKSHSNNKSAHDLHQLPPHHAELHHKKADR